jgi:hypothetical protein
MDEVRHHTGAMNRLAPCRACDGKPRWRRALLAAAWRRLL